MNNSPELTVILPCKDDGQNIEWLVPELIHLLEESAFTFEILIMDDSIANTNFDFPYTKTIKRTSLPSLAEALCEGIHLAKGEWIICMDSDGNHRPNDLRQMLLQLKESKKGWLVAERKFILDPKYTWAHQLVSYLLNKVIQVVCNLPTYDNTFGFFIAPKQEIIHMPLEKIFTGHGDYYFRLLSFANQNKISFRGIEAGHGKRNFGKADNHAFKRLFTYIKCVITHYFELRAYLYE